MYNNFNSCTKVKKKKHKKMIYWPMFHGQNGEGARARDSDLESNALSIGVECWTVQPQNPSEKEQKKVAFLCLLGSSLFFQPLKDLLEVGAAMLNAHLPTLLPRIYRHFALDSVWWWKIRTWIFPTTVPI